MRIYLCVMPGPDVIDEMYEEWGRRIRERRVALYTQEQFAFICGIRQATLSRIEAGKLPPNDAVKWRIAGGLGATMDELFAWPKERPPAPQVAA